MRAVGTAISNADGDTAVLTVFPDSKPQDAATEQLIHHLRGDVVPPVEAQYGGHVYVSGSTAAFIDLSDKVSSAPAVVRRHGHRAQLPAPDGCVPIASSCRSRRR